MEKLTNREKKMLYILSFVIILSIGIFVLILPAQTKHRNLQNEEKAVLEELAYVKESTIEFGNLKKDLADANAVLEEQSSKFYNVMETEDVDALLTTMAWTYGLYPVSLNIGESKKELLPNYEDSIAIQKDQKKEADVKMDEVLVYNVSIVVKGNVGNVQNLVNDANESKSMRVASVNYFTKESDKEITMTFKIYMI